MALLMAPVGHVFVLYKRQNMLDRNFNFSPLIVNCVFEAFGAFFKDFFKFGYTEVVRTNFWKEKP